MAGPEEEEVEGAAVLAEGGKAAAKEGVVKPVLVKAAAKGGAKAMLGIAAEEGGLGPVVKAVLGTAAVERIQGLQVAAVVKISGVAVRAVGMRAHTMIANAAASIGVTATARAIAFLYPTRSPATRPSNGWRHIQRL